MKSVSYSALVYISVISVYLVQKCILLCISLH